MMLGRNDLQPEDPAGVADVADLVDSPDRQDDTCPPPAES